MIGREGAKAHQRRGDRGPGQRLELAQQFAGTRAGIDHPAAGVEDRCLCTGDQFDRAGNVIGRGLMRRVIAVAALHRTIGEGRAGNLHILGNVDHHRAGAAGGGDLERLVDGRGKVCRVLHQVVVLGAVAGDADGIGFLEGVRTDQRGRHLSGDHYHRDRIHEGIGNAGDGIGSPRAAGDQYHAGLAGGAGIALRRVGRRRFVAHQNVADALIAEQRVVDRQHCATGIAEHIFDPQPHQAFDQNGCPAPFLAHVPQILNLRRFARFRLARLGPKGKQEWAGRSAPKDKPDAG